MKKAILMRQIHPIKTKIHAHCVQLCMPKEFHFHPTSASLSSFLQQSIESNRPFYGQSVQAFIIKSGFTINTNISIKLLILHLRCGCLSYAQQLFDQMSKPTVSSYNSMIAGYFKHAQVEESLHLVRKLTFSGEKADVFTVSMVLKICALLLMANLGKSAHTVILKLSFALDNILITALVDLYSKVGRIIYARRVYDTTSPKNLICSTALISGYMNSGSFECAEEIFRVMTVKDVVVFNAMIEGYSKSIDTATKSLKLYVEMLRLNFQPTISTFASLIGACSALSALKISQQVHCHLIKGDIPPNIKSGSALIDMYSKCGRTEDAQRIFDSMTEKNVFSWTSMVDGYGKNGNPEKALILFDKMRNESTVNPNDVTFLSALSACGHAGLVSVGWEIFNCMEKYSLKPKMEHYACMVDLLGRAGSLQQALDFIRQMPEKPNSDVWGALLGASRLHGNVELADFAASEIFKLSADGRPGAYIALSNTFAAAGEWNGVSEVRDLMKQRRVSKDAGCSWVGANGGIYGFHVGQEL